MGNLATEKVQLSIQNLREKKARIYFFVQDTKGNAKASIRLIYQMADALRRDGFNPIMLHEKKDYVGVASWLGEEFMTLPHRAIEGQNLEISPEDFLIIPEIFGFVMEQVKNLPCGKIVLCQAYDHIMETLTPGSSWQQFGFFKCITTTESQKEYISKIMRNISINVIKPTIVECFQEQEKPPKPIIVVHSRDQRDGLNLIKTFYLKYPQFRFFTFKDLRTLSEGEFSEAMKDAFLGVWLDPTSGFGTFPLECMASGIPVIGKLPNLKPDWMNESNGVWVQDDLQIVDVIADFAQTWLEDSVLSDLYSEGKKTSDQYKSLDEFNSEVVTTFDSFSEKRKEFFVQQLNQLN